jgi:hypothetical protein
MKILKNTNNKQKLIIKYKKNLKILFLEEDNLQKILKFYIIKNKYYKE